MNGHVALLGDSVLDNGAYTSGGPVVSVGGDDVLQNLDVLRIKTKSSFDALLSLGKRVAGFEGGYRAAIDRVRQLGLPTTVCTIYNGNLSGQEGAAARVAFNDVILRVAFESKL